MAALQPPPPDLRFTLTIKRKDGTEEVKNMVGWIQPTEKPTEQPKEQK